MERVKQQRKVIRSSVTRTVNKVKAEMEKVAEDRDKDLLRGMRRQLEQLQEKLNELDEQVLDSMLDELADDEELEEETVVRDEYVEKILTTNIGIGRFIDVVTPPASPRGSASNYSTASDAGTSEHKKRNYKLPKIELKKFSGDMEEWLGWWAQFSKIHEDEELYPADKFHYLVQSMTPGTRAHNLVKSYPPTVENYPKVIDTLKRRFGDKTLLAEMYIRKLQSVVLGLDRSKGKVDLAKLFDEIHTQLRCLESLEISLDHSAFLLPLIESTLPIELIKVWQRTSEAGYLSEVQKPTSDRLKSLMEFIEREVKGEERIKMIRGSGKEEHVKGKKYSNDDDVPTSQSLFNLTDESCIFCGKSNHASQDCFKAKNMTREEKDSKVKGEACFRCLKRDHRLKKCKAEVQCSNCGKGHYTIMCWNLQSNPNLEQSSQVTEAVKAMTIQESVVNASQVSKDRVVLMKTVQVDIVGSNGTSRRVRLLFDEGSNRSYIKTATAEKLKCQVLEEFNLQTALFGGHTTVLKPKKTYSVRLKSSNNKFSGEFQLINEDTICGQCPIIPKGPWMKELSKRKIFVNDVGRISPEIEVLIGSNLWPKLMTGKMFKLRNGLIAVESVFGWTISGELPIACGRENSFASTVISMLAHGEQSLPALWQLETIGIKDSVEQLKQEEHDQQVKFEFKGNITRDEDGRYKIQLPWIDRNIPLPTNRAVCEKRMLTNSNKLEREGLYNAYDKIFKDWENEGIIESVTQDENQGHYLPHHRVLKPDSKTTPLRPVFDASFKVGNNPSLNSCLERGPNLLELIPSILLRFREKDIGAIADIRKAFQMVSVVDEDKNYQKFLWWEGSGESKSIKVYRHARVVFGMNCSPFVLAAVLENHFQIAGESEPTTANLLKNSFYVDNCVLSLDTVEDYKIFKEVSTGILSDAKMDLRQWESNCENSEDKITSVLGLKWNKERDTLACKIQCRPEELKVNKRSVLSIIAQIFDPIGFTSPALLQPKLMLQSSWGTRLEWDEEWVGEAKEKFMTWYKDVSELGKIEIPRISIGSNAYTQLHLFTDASQDAYAAIVYARSRVQDKTKVQLLLAKSRLAPLPKKNGTRATIPRLELLGCLIGARLLKGVIDSLNFQGTDVFCWSDSSTALAWIKRDENWGTFVGNRVREINKISNKNQWRHVPGHLNPADLPSRGCSPYELRQSKWWEGPAWLYEEREMWPSGQFQPNEEEVAKERKKQEIVTTLVVEVEKRKFSTYWKNLRVAAWVRRFINNSRTKKDKIIAEQPTLDEMNRAEKDLLREIQNMHFTDRKSFKGMQVMLGQDGLLYVKTRLTYKEDSQLFKNPILLPNKEQLVEQLIEFTHKIYCHAGTQFILNKLRERYWIIQGRRTVSRVIHRCVVCRRYSAKSIQCDPAPLPVQRIESQTAFLTTGVDLAGPMYLKGGKKSWVVIYTCAVYRGVYLDIVDSISTEEFVNSLHKFTCVIGRPATMFSDNGTNFVGTQSLMKTLNWKKIEEELNVKQIKMRFNPPTAAWWGGWWERLIRSLKDLLRRMIARAKLKRKELETCLAEISYVMNNRPLTTLTENESDLVPLTPAMFMRDLPIDGLPEIEKITASHLRDAYQKLGQLKLALRGRFRKEYLGNLIEKKMEKTTPDPQIGDVVFIGSDNKKRFDWPLGRIVELFPGKDNKVRVARVKTSHGTLDRPLQRLYPLEIPNSTVIDVTSQIKDNAMESKKLNDELQVDDQFEDKLGPTDEDPRTRFGRRIKKPLRYGDH